MLRWVHVQSGLERALLCGSCLGRRLFGGLQSVGWESVTDSDRTPMARDQFCFSKERIPQRHSGPIAAFQPNRLLSPANWRGPTTSPGPQAEPRRPQMCGEIGVFGRSASANLADLVIAEQLLRSAKSVSKCVASFCLFGGCFLTQGCCFFFGGGACL